MGPVNGKNYWTCLKLQDRSTAFGIPGNYLLNFKGTGALIDYMKLYNDNAETWDTSVLVLTFPILHSSKMALIGPIFMI